MQKRRWRDPPSLLTYLLHMHLFFYSHMHLSEHIGFLQMDFVLITAISALQLLVEIVAMVVGMVAMVARSVGRLPSPFGTHSGSG